MRIYVASSQRNAFQQSIVSDLRNHGYEVYDFKNPAAGVPCFSWSAVDSNWKDWNTATFIRGLNDPVALEGYNHDKRGMDWADVCVLLLPCGKSAHAEAGFMAGQGKKVFVLLRGDMEAELMYNLFYKVVDTVSVLFRELAAADLKFFTTQKENI